MDFDLFKLIAEDPEHKALRQKAIQGYAARQKARDEKFEREAKAREPSESWYNRRYDI